MAVRDDKAVPMLLFSGCKGAAVACPSVAVAAVCACPAAAAAAITLTLPLGAVRACSRAAEGKLVRNECMGAEPEAREEAWLAPCA